MLIRKIAIRCLLDTHSPCDAKSMSQRYNEMLNFLKRHSFRTTQISTELKKSRFVCSYCPSPLAHFLVYFIRFSPDTSRRKKSTKIVCAVCLKYTHSSLRQYVVCQDLLFILRISAACIREKKSTSLCVSIWPII